MVWELGYSFHSLLETMTFRPQVANNQSLTISFYSILCLITPKPYLMLVIFFYLGFISLDSHHSQDSRGRGEEILTPLYYFHPLHKQFDFSQAITAESSPLHLLSDSTWTRNLWFSSTNCKLLVSLMSYSLD